jgi:hypothetical protein
MTRISSLAFALLIITAFGLQSASAQFPIPDIPRIKKPKADPPRTAGSQSEPAPALTAGHPPRAQTSRPSAKTRFR